MGARAMATLVAKNPGKYVAGVKPRAANSIAQFRLRAKALGTTRGNEKGQTCIAGKRKSNKAGKVMAKIVARAKDRTRKSKCEITGKSRPRRDIVCSRWLAQAASDIVLYEKQVTIFNQMVVARNDQTSCSEVGVLTAHLVSNSLSVVFLSSHFFVSQPCWNILPC